MDSYFKDINMLFYSVFFLFKLFLCLLYTVVVHLFQYGGEGWLSYTKGLRLAATLIELFMWELFQVCVRGFQIGAKFIEVVMWGLF